MSNRRDREKSFYGKGSFKRHLVDLKASLNRPHKFSGQSAFWGIGLQHVFALAP
ncbi:hypothetical protein JGUZn3_13230 [Entomobacter blattae]|uniref:Uncharacterized protein n=1 Tax=Entomobacter blattae TaxID=2762277 RepID=A0A7H1NRY9_9PROT|nr:hypothetical protein JGUZn3_13230 [Entomobacter blattae]